MHIKTSELSPPTCCIHFLTMTNKQTKQKKWKKKEKCIRNRKICWRSLTVCYANNSFPFGNEHLESGGNLFRVICLSCICIFFWAIFTHIHTVILWLQKVCCKSIKKNDVDIIRTSFTLLLKTDECWMEKSNATKIKSRQSYYVLRYFQVNFLISLFDVDTMAQFYSDMNAFSASLSLSPSHFLSLSYSMI